MAKFPSDRPIQNRLMVEGATERRVISELMEKNGIPWPDQQPPVDILIMDGYEQITAKAISVNLKLNHLAALGVLIDADENPQDRWHSIRDRALKSIDDLPEELPETGLLHRTKTGIRFGIWMMPDNRQQGMLETFLATLMPEQRSALWEFAQKSTGLARTDYGAPYTVPQTDKAQIYTWLAWQNPPGRQLHQAIKERIFQPDHPHAQGFVNWFKALYEL